MKKQTKIKIASYIQGFIFGVLAILALLLYQIVSREMEPEIISPLPDKEVIYKYIYVTPQPVAEPASRGLLRKASEPVKAQTDVRSIIRQVFADEGPQVVRQALTVAACESSLNSQAVNHNTNGTTDVGAFQINSVHGYGINYLKNPWNNAQVAYKLYKTNYWRAWYSSRKCHGL